MRNVLDLRKTRRITDAKRRLARLLVVAFEQLKFARRQPHEHQIVDVKQIVTFARLDADNCHLQPVKLVANLHEFHDFRVILWQKLDDIVVVFNVHRRPNEHARHQQQQHEHRHRPLHRRRRNPQTDAAQQRELFLFWHFFTLHRLKTHSPMRKAQKRLSNDETHKTFIF